MDRIIYIITLSFVAVMPVPAPASEAITYTYDAQGRLVGAVHAGDTNNGLDVRYELDRAGNRTNYNVTGSQNKGLKVIVVPLNGLTVIPLAD